MDAGPESIRRHLKATASAIFTAGLQAVNPETCVHRWLEIRDSVLQVGRETWNLDQLHKLYLIGAGKASAAMAKAAEERLGDRIDDGLVVTKYGHGVSLNRCRLMEAGHPVPDENGVRAAQAMLDLVEGAGHFFLDLNSDEAVDIATRFFEEIQFLP